MKSFLLEIGTEEIPARFVPQGLVLLKNECAKLLRDSFIGFGEMHEYATPRRLTILIENVSEKQEDVRYTQLGPPRNVAFDKDGNPTKAATGFARSLNIDISSTEIEKTDRGEYLSATIERKGRSTIDVLGEAIPKLIAELQLPKSMRWGDSSLHFFRPIHWIIALLGNRVIPFELDGIKSGNISRGHRFLSPVEITLNDPEDYLSALLRNHVVADISERRRIIERGIMQLESERNCTVHKDPELLETVTNLVEFPTVVACSFDEKYLDLPKELPVTVMRTHQKYFSTEDKEGNILPHFAVVSNTRPENNETVRRGAERVLRARLEDARFYYADDRKKPLIDYVEDLRNVTFQEKLGSLYDKTERVIEMCSFIAERIHIKNRDDLLRAAKLSRADLVTGVVSEFPELQGYMGKVYALHSGENSDVASAIFEHYLPRFAGDTLPTGEPGAVISLADKIDNIASFFLLDLIPTGSEDPYALRRQAAGIIHILQQKEYPLALDVLIDKALENVQAPDEERKVLNDRIVQFFRPRLEGIFQSQDYSPDIISAVLASGTMVIKDMRSRLDAILTLKAQSGFEDLLTAARRVYNILSRYEPGEVSEELFVESAEKDLHSAAHRVKEKAAVSDYNFLFELSGPIHTFFDKVLVMDEDPRIRENRIALLFSVRDVFETLGDFSKIQ